MTSTSYSPVRNVGEVEDRADVRGVQHDDADPGDVRPHAAPGKSLTFRIFVTTMIRVDAGLIWDEAKRKAKLAKHGLDFADAKWVLENDIRLDVVSIRQDEERTQSFAYVFDRLAVLMLVHVARESAIRIISFRPASEKETEIYHAWLKDPDRS